MLVWQIVHTCSVESTDVRLRRWREYSSIRRETESIDEGLQTYSYCHVFQGKNLLWTKLAQSYMQTAAQSAIMDQSYSISIEGIKHVVSKWSNGSFRMDHLVFSLGLRSTIKAYQIPWCVCTLTHVFALVFVINLQHITKHLKSFVITQGHTMLS